MYKATVEYETRKGNQKITTFKDLPATSLQDAEAFAASIMRDKRYQLKTIHSVKVERQRRGLFARLLGRG